MELGQRLRQARMEAGLSQRQLCGTEITRNMLSQIENGSARPSMDTLRYLAGRLGKPMGFFLEEQAVTSPNQAVMAQAREASGVAVLEILKGYKGPDATFDAERWLLEALACFEGAKQALEQGKPGYCANLLQRCAQAGANTPYYTSAFEQQRLFLCYEAGVLPARAFYQQVFGGEEFLLSGADAAVKLGSWQQAEGLLQAVSAPSPRWHYLMGLCAMTRQDYADAAEHLTRALPFRQEGLYALLEQCYLALEDYKQAYFYACKQKKT